MVTSISKMAAKKVDFRRLKEERQSAKKKTKIDSPLAKYPFYAGQLFCVLCNGPVKNELLWNAHIQSKKHKENLIVLKNKKKEAPPPPKTINTQKTNTFKKPVDVPKPEKRKTDQQSENIPQKKAKVSSNQASSLPSDFFDQPSKQESLVNHGSDDDDESDDDDTQTTVKPSQTSSSGLPADFFDNNENKETNKDKTKTRKPSELLPEGFFDDPKLDAKARHIEYKDPVEVEWEKFQKEIQHENQVSEALVEEDDEVARIDRQLNELNEQSEYFLRAHELRDKQTIIKQKIEEKVADGQKQQEDDSSDSDDFEDFFDWRAKKAL